MQIQFFELYKEYRVYLGKEFASLKYQKQLVHDTFCYVGLIKPDNFLLSCWDDLGMDDMFLRLWDILKEQGDENAERLAHLFRLAIEKLSAYLHNKYSSYKEIPIVEIPVKYDEFERQFDATPVDYENVFQRVLESDPGLLYLVDISKNAEKAKTNEWRPLVEEAKKGNETALNRLFGIYLNRILKDALQFSDRYRVELSDCIQEALYGFYEAVIKYPLNSDQPFPGYYQLWLQKNMLRNSSVGNSVVRCPVYMMNKIYDIINRINDFAPDFFDNYQMDNNLIEGITSAGEDPQEIESLVRLLLPSITLDDFMDVEDTDDYVCDESLLIDDDLCNYYMERTLYHQIDSVLKALRPREESVIRMRFGIGCREMTLEEIGQTLGVTRERVRQIESKALRKLRHPSLSKKLAHLLEALN